MKKFVWLVLLLSFFGAIVSAGLLYQYYYPLSEIPGLYCGSGLINTCTVVLQSKYSSILGVPNSLLGIFYYCSMLFMALLADYAKGKYFAFFSSLSIIATGLAVIFSIFLMAMLVVTGGMCLHCVISTVINILILVILHIFIKENKVSIIKEIYEGFSMADSPDKRAALASLMLFFVMLFFVIISTGHVIKLEAKKSPFSLQGLQNEVTKFYEKKIEKIDFKTGIIAGDENAKLRIHIFSDFLCSASRHFYNLEKYLLSKYKGRVALVYHHFPLDSLCNEMIKKSVYPNSCLASKALLLADKYHLGWEYLAAHYSGYNSYNDTYSLFNVISNFKKIKNRINIDTIKIDFESISLSNELKEHVKFSNSIKIEATPTIFISGRRSVGSIPVEILEEIIKIELMKFK